MLKGDPSDIYNDRNETERTPPPLLYVSRSATVGEVRGRVGRSPLVVLALQYFLVHQYLSTIVLSSGAAVLVRMGGGR